VKHVWYVKTVATLRGTDPDVKSSGIHREIVEERPIFWGVIVSAIVKSSYEHVYNTYGYRDGAV
jgi:hypothetical protein